MKYLDTIKKIALLVLGLIIVLSASYAFAGGWTPAPSPAPTSNTETLVDTGTTNEVKAGGLSVNNFIANENAIFHGSVYLHDIVRGGVPSDVNSTVYIGGVDPVQSINRIVNTFISGGLAAAGSSGTIKNIALVQTTGSPVPLCSDSTGTVAACTAPASSSGTGGTSSGAPANSNYNHIPPVYIYINPAGVTSQPGQVIGDPNNIGITPPGSSGSGQTTNYGMSVNANSGVDGISIGVLIVPHSTPGTPSSPNYSYGCPDPLYGSTYYFYVPPGGSSSDVLTFPPDCNGDYDVTITDFSPHVTRDNRQVVPGRSSTIINFNSSASPNGAAPAMI